MLLLIGISFAIMLASLAGVLVAGSIIKKHLDYLVSFSAGVFLIFLFGLGSEAVEHAQSPAWGFVWILIGAVGIWVLFKILPEAHVHEHHVHHIPIDPRRLLFTDGIHNAADGIFLAASYAISPTLALVAGISVFFHEVLQEIAEFFILRDAGYSTKKALGINFLVSSTVLIGAIAGFFLLETLEFLEAPLLGIAAGGLLVVVLHDLIPHSVRESITRSHYATHLLCFALGCVLMLAVSALIPHVEPEGGETALYYTYEQRG